VVEEGVRGMSVMDGTEQLAWVVLHSANRTQSRGSTARLVVPRAPEAADELGSELTDAQFRSVEEYLLDHGYVEDADIGLTWSAYTVTPAGLKWLETGLPEPLLPDRVRELAERPGEEKAFESALRAELEEDSRRMEEVDWELAEEPPEALEETRTVAKRELEALKSRREEVEELERDRDILLESYAGMVPEGLEEFGPEERRWVYKLIRLNVFFADAGGNLTATWMFTRAGVIQEHTRQDEGNAYARLGEVLGRLGREDEARAAYEAGIRQAEKFGHSGMAEDLRVALIQLRE
jgi:hypothetical protein